MYKPAQLTLGGDQNYSHFVTMDDGLYIPIPSHLLFPHPEISSHGFFDEFLTNTATPTCTHTHTCNAPSSSLVAMHTHTCLHRHTQVLASGDGEDRHAEQEPRNPRVIKPLGNREAVRKYREKKKARAAFLEEEVRKLRAANQQLLRRLQGHATLEAEVVRLRSLLVDVRAKIDTEVAVPVSPFQNQKMPLPCSVGSVACSDRPALCFNGNSGAGAWEESSRPAAADCRFEEVGNGGAARETDVLEQVHSMDVADLCFHS